MYFPNDVLAYINSKSFAMVSFDWSSLIIFKQIKEWFDYEQEWGQLSTAGLESGSTFINISGMLLILIFGIITHISLEIIFQILKKYCNPNSAC